MPSPVDSPLAAGLREASKSGIGATLLPHDPTSDPGPLLADSRSVLGEGDRRHRRPERARQQRRLGLGVPAAELHADAQGPCAARAARRPAARTESGLPGQPRRGAGPRPGPVEPPSLPGRRTAGGGDRNQPARARGAEATAREARRRLHRDRLPQRDERNRRPAAARLRGGRGGVHAAPARRRRSAPASAARSSTSWWTRSPSRG